MMYTRDKTTGLLDNFHITGLRPKHSLGFVYSQVVQWVGAFGLSVPNLEPGCGPDGLNGCCSCDHSLSSCLVYLQEGAFTEAHSLFNLIELCSQVMSAFPNPDRSAAKGDQACTLDYH